MAAVRNKSHSSRIIVDLFSTWQILHDFWVRKAATGQNHDVRTISYVDIVCGTIFCFPMIIRQLPDRCRTTSWFSILWIFSLWINVAVDMVWLMSLRNGVKNYSTTVIAKIKEMARSLFYVIPRYVTMDYENDTHLSFWNNVRKSVYLKFKIMSITCRCQVSDMVLTFLIS